MHREAWPSKGDVMEGIITLANQQMQNRQQIQTVIDTRITAWIVFFLVTGFGKGDLNKPIDPKILQSNPQHPICQTLLYIYSMETFIPYMLSKTSRDKDESKVDLIGPYAVALEEVLTHANSHRDDFVNGEYTVWRGL